MPKVFWQFRNLAGGKKAELLLYGNISDTSWWDDEVTPKQFAKDLDGLGAVSEIIVRINSGGGAVFAAQTIGNLLEQHPAMVTAQIDGLCASAATVVACHCNKVVAANDSTYMVHPVKMGICGYLDAVKMNEYISALATVRENIVTLYAKKTGREKEEVSGWMDATSWWTGPQAKENGFVDELTHDDNQHAAVENRNGVLFVNSVSMGLPFEAAPGFLQDSLAAPPAASGFENTQTKKEETEVEIKNVEDLRKAYPALVDQIEQEAAERATNAERQRIRDIEEMALPGSEEMATEAKFERPVAAAEYAKAAVKRMKAQGEAWLKNAEEDAGPLGNVGQTTPPKGGDKIDDEMMAAIRNVAQPQK